MSDLSTLLKRVEDAADAFLYPIEGSFDSEHGISQDEARRGALAVMVHLGVLSADEQRVVERHWKAVERAAERRQGGVRFFRSSGSDPHRFRFRTPQLCYHAEAYAGRVHKDRIWSPYSQIASEVDRT